MNYNFFLKKSIKRLVSESNDNQEGLKRSLGAWNLTSIGIGAIIGAGLFVLTGETAAHVCGPAVSLSFLIAAIVCGFAALCYAEFSSMIPISGSAYTYAYVAIGEFFAWLMGLALTVEFMFSYSTVAVGWSGYFCSILRDFNIHLPATLSQSPVVYNAARGFEMSGALINLPALLLIACSGWLALRGTKNAAFVNNLLVYIKLAVIAVFVLCGVCFLKLDNLTPFIPENSGIFGEFGWSGVFRGAGILFFSYLGFDSVATMAQEAKNPQRDLPIGMLSSLLISGVAYVLFGIVLTGLVSYSSLAAADPIGIAVQAFGPSFAWLKPLINLAILSGLTSVVLVMLMGQARIFFVIAKDGLLPQALTKVHRKYRTPTVATAAVTLLGIFFSGFFPINLLGSLSAMGALLAFNMVCFGVWILRKTQPRASRPFKTPGGIVIPLLGIGSCTFLMLTQPGSIWIQFLSYLALGSLFYFCYGCKHSHLQKEHQQ